MKKIIYSLLFVFCLSNKLFAQFECGNPIYEQELIAKHPEIQINKAALDAFVKKYIQEHGKEAKSGNKYIIPIVFHVIHYYGTEDITDAQIKDEIKVLNIDYNKLNSDTTDIIPQFKGIADLLPVEFRLANKDQLGNCTNGIERIVSMRTNQAADFSKLSPWSRNMYLNVWTVRTIGKSGTAGYAYNPSTVAADDGAGIDGIIILSSYIGRIGTGTDFTSRALTHEIGHFLGLLHPWGATNSPEVACGDDEIEDTPFTMGFLSCPTYGTTATGLCTKRIYTVGSNVYIDSTGSPFYSPRGSGGKVQYLIKGTEMDSAKIFGTYIDSVSFNLVNNGTKAVTIPNITIRIGSTNATSIGSTFLSPLPQTVYTAATTVIAPGATTVVFKFSIPFVWDHTAKNVIIQICHDSIPGGGTILAQFYSAGNGIYEIANDACDSTSGISCGRPVCIFNCRTIENYQNYMDYSYCSRMFTHDQAQEMDAVLNSPIANRINLWQQGNLTLTGVDTSIQNVCVPQADFFTKSQNGIIAQTYCTNTAIPFTDASWKATPTSWNWNFGDDATPMTSTSKNTTASFSTPGYKTITLTVSNAAGTSSVTKQNLIYITDPSAPQYGNNFYENFEGGSLESKGWIVLNPENNNSKWALSNAGSADPGTTCVKLNNFGNMPSDMDVLISPSMDLSSGSSSYLRFKYSCAAGAIDTTYIQDVFKIYVSIDCGKTWNNLKTISKLALTNAASYPYEYPLNSNYWNEVSVPLSSIVQKNNVRFRFEYTTNGDGNDIYLDDIFVSNFTAGIDDMDASVFDAQVFPNPASGNASLVINTPVSMQANISLFDITGRKISTLYQGLLTPGTRTLNINGNLLKGMYLINIEGDNKSIKKKVIFF